VAARHRQQALTVSLYAIADPTFRTPLFRAKLEPGAASLKVPAGAFIASLASAGNAPDLQRLKAQPGESARLTYHALQGWSLLVRVRATGTERLLAGVRVHLAKATGFGLTERRIAEAASEPDGLVLFSGLRCNLAALVALHPAFLKAEASGLTAAPGTFAFREVALATGGHLRAQISVHGRILPRVQCRISRVKAVRNPDDPYQEVWHGRADAKGVCRSGVLGAGIVYDGGGAKSIWEISAARPSAFEQPD
jgi:hypothetical protein